jgi:apolipoprotein N-acyltransferase
MLPGDHQVLLESAPIRAAVLNCFEDTLPEAGLEAADVNPNLLVNLTNDAWFSGTEESELHLRIATMRAIELRRDFVRAVNLGPTSWVDATGKVRARYDLAIPGSLPTQPALLEMKTMFAKLGDLSGALLLGLLSLATWLGMRSTKRMRRAASHMESDTPLS